jgi:uncharacterized membrane protein YqhA
MTNETGNRRERLDRPGRRNALRTDPRFEANRHLGEPAIGASRFILVLAIAGTLLSAFTMLIFGLLVVLKIIWRAFTDAAYDVEHAKHLAVELTEMTDLFLLGMVLYVVALGMFQLFINADIPVPSWMRVDSLNDLKSQLVNVIVVLLAVSFLATAVSWTSDRSILYFGCSIAVVVLSLSIFNLIHHRMEHDGDETEPAGE